MEEVADATKFRRAAKFVPFTLERRHFEAFGQMLVEFLEGFVVEMTTIASPEVTNFMQFALSFCRKSFTTMTAPVFRFYVRLSKKARWWNRTVGRTILQARVVAIGRVEIHVGFEFSL